MARKAPQSWTIEKDREADREQNIYINRAVFFHRLLHKSIAIYYTSVSNRFVFSVFCMKTG